MSISVTVVISCKGGSCMLESYKYNLTFLLLFFTLFSFSSKASLFKHAQKRTLTFANDSVRKRGRLHIKYQSRVYIANVCDIRDIDTSSGAF